MKSESSLCPAVWFSGFFGLGALVHLIRLLFRVPVVLGDWAVPLKFSAAAVMIFGGLSLGLLALALKKPCAPLGGCGKDAP